mmetsp:Transcript_25750/g.56425  ORF Transcript_25750/g.56425 Transcript_25750/m.56425 type:complete len:209 (+) Transcript_25750:772-1398(+)
MGYLAGPLQGIFQTERDWWTTLVSSWALAKRLEGEYGIRHLGLEGPRNITISHEMAAGCMNRNLWRRETARFLTRESESFVAGKNAFIQKVKTAPKPNLFIGCTKSKAIQFEREFGSFASNIRQRRSFADQFTKYMRQARHVMKKEPCLMEDFQVLVDTSGVLYHLDFDRCFEQKDRETNQSALEEYRDSCFAELDKIEKRVVRVLTK